MTNPNARPLVLLAVGFGLGLAAVRVVLQWPGIGADIVTDCMIAMLGPVLVLLLMLTRDQVDWPDGLGENWLRLGIGCGIGAFMLASMVDFGMTQAGSANALWTLAAIAVAGKMSTGGEGSQAASGTRRGARATGRAWWLIAAGLALGLIALVVNVYLPVKRAEGLMLQVAKGDQPVVETREMSGRDGKPVTVNVPSYSEEFWREALSADRWEPEIPVFLANQLRTRLAAAKGPVGAAPAVEQVKLLYEQAVRRDPEDPQYKLLLGQWVIGLAETDADRDEALGLVRQAAELAPQSVEMWKQYGQTLLGLAEERHSPGLDAQAAEAFDHALKIDDTVRRYDVKGRATGVPLFTLSAPDRAKLQRLCLQARSGIAKPATRPAGG